MTSSEYGEITLEGRAEVAIEGMELVPEGTYATNQRLSQGEVENLRRRAQG